MRKRGELCTTLVIPAADSRGAFFSANNQVRPVHLLVRLWPTSHGLAVSDLLCRELYALQICLGLEELELVMLTLDSKKICIA